MSKIALEIIYLPSNSDRPLRVVRVDDPVLIRQVAKRAIQSRYQQAERLKKVDYFASRVKKQEAKRLEIVLTALVPELNRERNIK